MTEPTRTKNKTKKDQKEPLRTKWQFWYFPYLQYAKHVQYAQFEDYAQFKK